MLFYSVLKNLPFKKNTNHLRTLVLHFYQKAKLANLKTDLPILIGGFLGTVIFKKGGFQAEDVILRYANV